MPLHVWFVWPGVKNVSKTLVDAKQPVLECIVKQSTYSSFTVDFRSTMTVVSAQLHDDLANIITMLCNDSVFVYINAFLCINFPF